MNVLDQRWPDPSPMRNDPEPTEQQIRWYAEQIKPRLMQSKEDLGDLLAGMTGTHGWDDFAMFLLKRNTEAFAIGSSMLNHAAKEESERIATDMLYGDEDHSGTLQRIGAPSVEEFRDWLNRQYAYAPSSDD